MRVDVSASNGFRLVEVEIPEAASLDADAFHLAARAAYDHVARTVDRVDRIVRFWNFIPDILRPEGPVLRRYELFNRARYETFERWYGDALGRSMPAATGVGHRGRSLVVHALEASRPGTPVENPSQVPAYRYSPRFGPRPPCFSRAVLAELPIGASGASSTAAILSGTASVLGEETHHADDVDAQTRETIENLRRIVGTCLEAISGHALGPDVEPLESVDSMRLYLVRSADHGRVVEHLVAAAPRCRTIEVMAADLCRPDLLVEVEGLAQVSPESLHD